jgi:hypothetical protein
MKTPLRFSIPKETTIRRGRRKMAWTSLVSMIVITLLMMFIVKESRLESLSSIIDTVLYCLAGVVLAYNGVALYDDTNLTKTRTEENCDNDKDDSERKKKEDALIKKGGSK